MKRAPRSVSAQMDGLRKRVIAQLREIGIDVETIQTEDRSVVMASRALSAVKKAMDGKGKRNVVWPTAPTPERSDHARGKIVSAELQPGQPRVHATIWPVDTLRKSMDGEQYSAACQFYEAWSMMNGRSNVSGYEPGGGGYRPRLEMSERQQQAGQEFVYMEKAILHRLGPMYLDCARNFILELPISGGRTLDWIEFGKLFGNPGDSGAARWIARGALMAVCSVIANARREIGQGKRRA